MRLLAALVLSPPAALFAAAAALTSMPGDLSDRLVLSGLMFPLLWPVLFFFCYWPRSRLAPCAVLAVAATVCGFVAFRG